MMKDATPNNYQDYLFRFSRNQKFVGYGLKTEAHVPCPFCAAADFMRYRIVDIDDEIQKVHTCSECGRSAKAVITKIKNVKRFDVLQTGGPDQPDWLVPKMRRIS